LQSLLGIGRRGRQQTNDNGVFVTLKMNKIVFLSYLKSGNGTLMDSVAISRPLLMLLEDETCSPTILAVWNGFAVASTLFVAKFKI